ncbi:hypothetical protein NMT73_24890, partial [Escherichia coli]|nr:hypothetical protein [Escherichia coli]
PRLLVAPAQASTWPYSVTDDCACAPALAAPSADATASAAMPRLNYDCIATSFVVESHCRLRRIL